MIDLTQLGKDAQKAARATALMETAEKISYCCKWQMRSKRRKKQF